jgi:hypothetical protein
VGKEGLVVIGELGCFRGEETVMTLRGMNPDVLYHANKPAQLFILVLKPECYKRYFAVQ